VSTQLGVMDDLQRVSQNFMDGMDVETGAVDDAALKALNAFEQKALTAGGTDFKMMTTDSVKNLQPVGRITGSPAQVASGKSDLDDLL
jgi:thiamine monophosphate kinase